jgi:tRNA(Ile)-lysidine synthase
MKLLQKVYKTINRYSMLSDKDHVLIGLSGGPDSICLSVVLDKLKKDFNLSLSAVYVDHGLRPGETGKEVDFCRQFCNDRGINFIEKKIDTKTYVNEKGKNLQEAARELRYRIFYEVADDIRASNVAIGHNADDQAETVLMRLLRGSGRKGLSGIPPVRDKIIRPLIETERKEIEEFLTLNSSLITHNSSTPYMVDSSNLNAGYFRNWIRLTLMDEIKGRNPAIVDDICRTAEILREEDDYLELIVTKTLMRLISRKSDNSIELFLFPLETIEKPVLRRVLRRAISATKSLKGVGYIHIEDIIKLIKEGKSGDRLDLPKDIRVIKDYSLIKITTGKQVKISSYELQPPGEIIVKEAGIVIRASIEEKGEAAGDGRASVLLDAGAMNFPLKIRAREAGDFFYPLGFGKRKKLKDFFIDEKISRDDRDKVPVVLSENDIIWVAGYRADERFKVTDGTEKLLRLTISRSKS